MPAFKGLNSGKFNRTGQAGRAASCIQKITLKLSGVHKIKEFSRINNHKIVPTNLTGAKKTGLSVNAQAGDKACFSY